MIIVRPIQKDDYDSLYQIAIDSGHGFTSLPIDEAMLRKKIERSEQSFKKNVITPGDEGYLFVMQDTESGEIVGTSGIEAAVGLDSPFYHYHLGKVVHSCDELKVHNSVKTLTLCNDFTGVSEICTLFLKEKARVNSNGRFLSRFRFLFIGEHEDRFSTKIIAEMRGVSDSDGRSPFWEWLEKHFFSIDFPTADYLTGTGNKDFIAQLMPKYPIYVSLLSPEAQAVINKVHKNTEPAIRLLESEGFCRSDYVDIFDAGPTIFAQRQHIKTINQSRKLQVTIVDDQNGSADDSSSMQQKYLVCNTKVEGFRAIQIPLQLCDNDSHAILTSTLASHLGVSDNDWLRVIAN
jgi:arginine N-succinyltransferase